MRSDQVETRRKSSFVLSMIVVEKDSGSVAFLLGSRPGDVVVVKLSVENLIMCCPWIDCMSCDMPQEISSAG